MVTKQEAAILIESKHAETGHGGEKVTFKQIKDLYHNIPMKVVKKYISNCEICSQKRRRKETGPGMVFKPCYKAFNSKILITKVMGDFSIRYLNMANSCK